MKKVIEILREIYWEALRAPSINTTMLKNPYRREFIIKKFLGKTKAERIAKKEELKKLEEEVKRNAHEREIFNKKEEDTKRESIRKRQRQMAEMRFKLGFNDKG